MKRKLFTLMLAAIAAISVFASADRGKFYTIDSQGRKTYWSPEGKKLNTEQSGIKMPMKAPVKIATLGEPKLLDIEVKYNENEYLWECLTGGPSNYTDFSTEYWGLNEKNLGIIEVPDGIEALICVFLKYNKISKIDEIKIVAKDITSLQNGSKVIFDIEDCVHKITYIPVAEDGNPLKSLEESEYNEVYANISINHISDNLLYDLNTFLYEDIEEPGRYYFPSIYLNNCGANFFVSNIMLCEPSQGHNFTAIEMPVYVGESSLESTDIILKNDPTRYQTYIQQWSRSPYSISNGDKLYFFSQIGLVLKPSNICPVIIQGITDHDSDKFIGIKDLDTELKVCTNNPLTVGSDLAGICLVDIMPNDDTGDNPLISMWWEANIKESRKYLPINYTGNGPLNSPFEAYENFIENNYNEWLDTKGISNPHLAFEDSKAMERMGNNSPIISLFPAEYYLYFSSDFVPYYTRLVGRYGECDFQGQTLLEEINSYEYDENNVRKEVFMYENISIDGEIEGCVTAELSIKRGSGMNEDYIPPVLTYLGMNNKEGMLTDRFNTATDGIIYFYASDFYANFDWSLGELINYPQYLCNTIPTEKIKVEYVPYGGNNYSELPVTEVPEKYFFPGWGSYYTVPLESVKGYSENGWFDLRITLEDETGNKHVQTVSPAFKILDATGIESVNEELTTTPVYYNMQGVQVANPENGIYIERIGNQTRKVIK
ncbi:MAG: hypothetical protein HDR88_15315 [Bacteroides sp.]|nr:hypothetical protein [Bacteroides sp.]